MGHWARRRSGRSDAGGVAGAEFPQRVPARCAATSVAPRARGSADTDGNECNSSSSVALLLRATQGWQGVVYQNKYGSGFHRAGRVEQMFERPAGRSAEMGAHVSIWSSPADPHVRGGFWKEGPAKGVELQEQLPTELSAGRNAEAVERQAAAMAARIMFFIELEANISCGKPHTFSSLSLRPRDVTGTTPLFAPQLPPGHRPTGSISRYEGGPLERLTIRADAWAGEEPRTGTKRCGLRTEI